MHGVPSFGSCLGCSQDQEYLDLALKIRSFWKILQVRGTKLPGAPVRNIPAGMPKQHLPSQLRRSWQQWSWKVPSQAPPENSSIASDMGNLRLESLRNWRCLDVFSCMPPTESWTVAEWFVTPSMFWSSYSYSYSYSYSSSSSSSSSSPSSSIFVYLEHVYTPENQLFLTWPLIVWFQNFGILLLCFFSCST